MLVFSIVCKSIRVFLVNLLEIFSTCIEPELLGHSPLVWWPEVVSHYGSLTVVTPLYRKFKQVLIADLRL